MFEVNGIETVPPLHTDEVAALDTLGAGLTVTVTVWLFPAQLPDIEVGVTA
jgi:hypothetical protein